MATANPTWGSPRIVGELQKLGIAVAKATVERYMVRPRKPPSPTWLAFLAPLVEEEGSAGPREATSDSRGYVNSQLVRTIDAFGG